MNYRKFGNTDMLVSEIGFGAWAIGGPAMVGSTPIGWGPADDSISKTALKAALDAGINFFDTADFYGLGHSETLIGNVIGNDRNALVATKVGQTIVDEKIVFNNTKAHIIDACEQSLRRLKRDAIDFYQFHVAKLADLQQGACIEAMEQLQQQGKVRYWGTSLFTWQPAPEAAFVLENHTGSGVQLVVNLINQRSVPFVEQAGEKGFGVIARMPLQFGLLSGNIRPATVFAEDDHRAFRLTPNVIQNTLDILRTEIVPMAKNYDTSLAGIALSFALSFKEVSTVIPGIRTPRHVALNTSGLVQLSETDQAHLKRMYETHWQPVLAALEGI